MENTSGERQQYWLLAIQAAREASKFRAHPRTQPSTGTSHRRAFNSITYHQVLLSITGILGFQYNLVTGIYILEDRCSPPGREKNSKPPTGEILVPHEQTIKLKPNGVKQGGTPEAKSPGIANPKGDPNGRQTELVPRRPRENSNEDPSISNSEAPEKPERNPRKGISFEFHSQVRFERAPKGNKFLGAQRKISTQSTISTWNRVRAKRKSLASVGQKFLRQQDKLYVAYNFYVDPN